MVERNPTFSKLSPNYLFKEIRKRTEGRKDLISLGIGDTCLPLPQEVSVAMQEKAKSLGTPKGYSGYGHEQGDAALRQKIAKSYPGVNADEVFLSDGAKCDVGRLCLLFGKEASIGVQDPTYPVYVDTALLLGNNNIHTLPCTPENDFFPTQIPPCDLLYICSPNNPTGIAYTRAQLTQLVDLAQQRGMILLFDSAYSNFITEEDIPRSIYEIPDANHVAIEIGSFSKSIGFTGVRLGFTIIPRVLRYADGRAIHPDWVRIVSTFFNGPSNIATAGALAAEVPNTQLYMNNAQRLRGALEKHGLTVYGGINAPYLWVYFGQKSSWDYFDLLLEKCGLITTPGSGFGSSGEGFLRFSAFATEEMMTQTIRRMDGLTDLRTDRRLASSSCTS